MCNRACRQAGRQAHVQTQIDGRAPHATGRRGVFRGVGWVEVNFTFWVELDKDNRRA